MKKLFLTLLILFLPIAIQIGCQKNNPVQSEKPVQALVVDNFEDSNLTNQINIPNNQWTYDLSYSSSMQSFGVTAAPSQEYGNYVLGLTGTAKATTYLGGNFVGYINVKSNTLIQGGGGLNVSTSAGYKRIKFGALCRYTQISYNSVMVYFVRIYNSDGSKYMEYSALNITDAWQDFDIPLSNFGMLTGGTVDDVCSDMGQIVFTLRIQGDNNAKNSVHFYLDNVQFTQ